MKSVKKYKWLIILVMINLAQIGLFLAFGLAPIDAIYAALAFNFGLFVLILMVCIIMSAIDKEE